MSDPYDVLGVERDCDLSSIKKAYRKLSLQYHPDRNNSNEANEKMLKINAAYEIIGEADQRKLHDGRNGLQEKFQNQFPQGFSGGFHQNFQGAFPQNFQGAFNNGQSEEFVDLKNIFNMMFQGGLMGNHFSKQLSKPPPIIKNITISLEQCYNGCVLPMEIEKWIIQNDVKIMRRETIHINIPHGIDTNEFFVISERGNEVNDYTIGDIKIIVSIAKNDIFEKVGLDLIFKKTITLKESLCGVSFTVNHLNGDNICLMNKKNPTIIRPTLKKTINNMGFRRDDNIGNLIIIFDVEFPNELSQEQISVLETLL